MTEVDRVKIIVEEVTGAGEERDLKQRWQVRRHARQVPSDTSLAWKPGPA
jgi:hypothetical protein